MTTINVPDDVNNKQYCCFAPLQNQVYFNNTSGSDTTVYFNNGNVWVNSMSSYQMFTYYNPSNLTTGSTPEFTKMSMNSNAFSGSSSPPMACISSGYVVYVPNGVNDEFSGNIPPSTTVTFSNTTDKNVTVHFSNPAVWTTAPNNLGVPAQKTNSLKTVSSKGSSTELSMTNSFSDAVIQVIQVPQEVSNPNFIAEVSSDTQVTFKNNSNATKTVYFRNPNVWQDGSSSVEIPGSSHKTLTTVTTNVEIFTEISLKEGHWDNGPHALLKVKETTVYAKIAISN